MLGSSLVPWSFLSSSFLLDVVGLVGVVVSAEARAESTGAELATRREIFRDQPLLVISAIVWEVVHGLLEDAVALHRGALLASMAKLVNKTVSKVAFLFTVIVHEVTIGVGLLEGEGLHLDVRLQVGVFEGGSEGAAVGSPGRQLAAVGADREHRDSGPWLRDGVTWAGGVLRRRGAWR